MIGLLLMGTVFIIIGLLFIGYEVYWRIKSETVNGVISAVIQDGKYYYSVFKYKTRSGETYEKESSLGSNSIISRLPGTKLKILIMPDNPEKIRRPTYVWLLFGITFFLPGLFIMNLALKKFEFNYIIALFILAALLFGGEKVHKFYKKVTKSKFDRELLSEFWKDIKSGKKPTSKPLEIKGKILQNHEIIKKAREHLKYSKITALVFFLMSLGLGYWRYCSGQEMMDMMENGITTRGTVISIDTRNNSEDVRYTYYAIVRYTDNNGDAHQFTDKIGSSTPLYNRNDSVDVLYDPLSPETAIIDRGIFNWGISAFAVLLAIAALWGSFLFFNAKKHFEKQLLLNQLSRFGLDE